MKNTKKAFTLVELIVVITILAILGTIAFISLQGYSKSARDSTRISDLSVMKTSLGLFHLDAGKYPNTTEGFDVLYSGTTVWTQGTFGEQTKNNVSRLDKIPKDPLTDKEYTYSLTKTKQEYELAGIMEADEIALTTKAIAAEEKATAIVQGNYNGVLFKTSTGTTCEILSVPSIVSTEGSEETNLVTILTDKKLVYNGYNNLPSNYKGSKYKTTEGFDFETKQLVVYSDTKECKPLYEEDSTARIQLITNLQKAYSGTLIQNTDKIKTIVQADPENTQALEKLSSTLVSNNLGGKPAKQTSNTLVCNEGEHTEDGIVCISDIGTCEIENGTGINTWNGNNWDCTVNTCENGYIASGNNCIQNAFNVTFDKNGGTGGTTTVIAAYLAGMPVLSTIPTKPGYIFDGYFSEINGGTKYYNANKTSANIYDLTTDTTLYAQWVSPCNVTPGANISSTQSNLCAPYADWGTPISNYSISQTISVGAVCGGYFCQRRYVDDNYLRLTAHALCQNWGFDGYISYIITYYNITGRSGIMCRVNEDPANGQICASSSTAYGRNRITSVTCGK